MNAPNKYEDGFTLIEVLVATVILAISLTIVFQVFSSSLRAGVTSENYTQAILHARQKMDEMMLMEYLGEGEIEGAWDDGYSWRVQTRPANEGIIKKNNERVGLFQINVVIKWMEGPNQKDMEITTMKMALQTNEADDS